MILHKVSVVALELVGKPALVSYAINIFISQVKQPRPSSHQQFFSARRLLADKFSLIIMDAASTNVLAWLYMLCAVVVLVTITTSTLIVIAY